MLQIVVGTDRHTVQLNLKMQMSAEGIARVADQADVLPARHVISRGDEYGGRVHVLGHQTAAVRDDDPIARAAVITAVVGGVNYRAALRSVIRRSLSST